MNKTKSILRIAVLFTLMALGLVFVLNVNYDFNSSWVWLHAIVDKTIGILLIVASGLLYNRWSVSDEWISRYEEWNQKESEYEIWD